MLLIHDDEAELVKLDRSLEQRMGADGEQRCAGRDAFCGGGFFFFLQAAGQPHRF